MPKLVVTVPRGKAGTRNQATRAAGARSGNRATNGTSSAMATRWIQKVTGGSLSPSSHSAVSVASPPAAKEPAVAKAVTRAATRPASGPPASSAAQAVAPPATRPIARPWQVRATASAGRPGAMVSAVVARKASTIAASRQGFRPMRSDRPPSSGAVMISVVA